MRIPNRRGVRETKRATHLQRIRGKRGLIPMFSPPPCSNGVFAEAADEFYFALPDSGPRRYALAPFQARLSQEATGAAHRRFGNPGRNGLWDRHGSVIRTAISLTEDIWYRRATLAQRRDSLQTRACQSSNKATMFSSTCRFQMESSSYVLASSDTRTRQRRLPRPPL